MKRNNFLCEGALFSFTANQFIFKFDSAINERITLLVNSNNGLGQFYDITGGDLNQTSIFVTALGNNGTGSEDSGTHAESMTNGELEIDGSGGVAVGVVDITPTAGEWILDPLTQGFTINTTTGVMTYNGIKDIDVGLNFKVIASPVSGPNQNLVFDIRINGVQQTKSITNLVTSDIDNAIYVGGLFKLSNGDTIQLFKNNTTNTNNTNVTVPTILITSI